MVVQHNLTAMNANRMLGVTTGQQAKSSEKLSSGYRINRAADDAAGLTISEKMRKQIRGLDQASTNAQDGVSCVQTAEGALTEVHSMLQRMNELAVQSANGTNAEVDRKAIQAEIDQLVTEIDRVSTTTKFNETYLLKGDEAKGKKDVYAYKTIDKPEGVTYADGKAFGDFFKAGTTAAYTTEADLIADLKAGKKVGTAAATITNQVAADQATSGAGNYYEIVNAKAESTITLTAGTPNNATVTSCTYTYDDGAGKWVYKDANGTADTAKDITGKAGLSGDAAIAGASYTTADVVDGTVITVTAASVRKDGDLYKQGETTALTDTQIITEAAAGTQLYKAPATTSQPEATKDDVAYVPAGRSMAQLYDASGAAVAAEDIAAKVDAGDTLYTDKNAQTAVTDMTKYTAKGTVTEALTLKLHVGADSDESNKIAVEIKSMSAAGIGVMGLDVSTEDSATTAIDTISAAIQKVSEQRSALGAVQNRLEHTIANLDNVVENTTAAESRIRDTDMAEEMVEYSKNNILAQAGQSMLAQANQSTQGVLSLLQ